MHGNMILRPWAGAREQGRQGLAGLLFFMQVSLVFWPAAVRVAYRLEQERQKQVLLNELAAVHAYTPRDSQDSVTSPGFTSVA